MAVLDHVFGVLEDEIVVVADDDDASVAGVLSEVVAVRGFRGFFAGVVLVVGDQHVGERIGGGGSVEESGHGGSGGCECGGGGGVVRAVVVMGGGGVGGGIRVPFLASSRGTPRRCAVEYVVPVEQRDGRERERADEHGFQVRPGPNEDQQAEQDHEAGERVEFLLERHLRRHGAYFEQVFRIEQDVGVLCPEQQLALFVSTAGRVRLAR